MNTVSPIPTSAYGAAPGQAGTWNAAPAGTFGQLLNGLGGAATTVTLTETGSLGSFGFNNVGTSGDDGNLLDDYLDLGSPGNISTVTFANLANGDYSVYTYAWAADNRTGFCSQVNVLGSPDPQQVVCGAWTGSHVQGVTYALHQITVTAGVIQITVESTPTGTFGTINGFQVVPNSMNTGASGCDCSAGNTSCFNASAVGAGCPNTAGGGAVLTGAGHAQVSNDSFSLSVSGGVAGQFGLVLSGTASIGPIYTLANSAGGLCTGGSTDRSDVYQLNGSGAINMPTFKASVGGGAYGAASGAGFQTYQFWYRDPGGAAGCTTDVAGADFNFTNGWSVTWL